MVVRHICGVCGQLYGGPGSCAQDGSTLGPASDDVMLGQTIGNYRITRLIGAGGMGRVYAAAQPSIGARVAIKVLSNDLAHDQELVGRFFAEARAVNLIRHENIVNILDLATLPDGRPYIVMEFLDGMPLSSMIEKRGPLPLGSMTTLMGEVLDALGAAHASGIVHRDLKPDNIFVTPAGHAEVLDFGIAKLDAGLSGGSAAGQTKAGSLLGTPPYMSPEQATAKPVDHRSDIYSMGVILYEAATGKVPFQAESLFEILRMHLQDPPAPPRTLRPDLPEAMEQVILRALEKDPAKRFATAGDMASALAAATQGLPQQAWATLRMTAGVPVIGPPPGMATGPITMPNAQWAAVSARGSTSAPPVSAVVSAPPPPPVEKKKGRLGLWLGLGLVLVGGGAVAAVMMSRGSATAAAPVTTTTTPVPATTTPPAAVVTPTTPTAATPTPAPVAAPPDAAPAASPPDATPAATPPPVAAVQAGPPDAAPVADEGTPDAAVEDQPGVVPKSGIPACDEYVAKYIACLEKHVPPASRQQLIDSMTMAVKQWAPYASSVQARDAIEKSCRQAEQQAKQAMVQQLGCKW